MKKRITLLLLTAFATCCVMAKPIGINRAANRASSLLGKSVTATESVTNEVRSRVPVQSAAPAYYVFNATDTQGFVIISGDDQMPEVVAYSYTNWFNAADMHPALVEMLSDYTQLVNDVRAGLSDAPAMAPAVGAKAVVAPLCASEWGQDKPYNTLCPQSGGKDCPVGCVATAMAQIMYHFRWPEVGEGTVRYASGISGVGVLSSIFSDHHYAWDIMGKTKAENLESEEAAAAVAQLSYDCGVATRMSYAPEGSGTNDDLAMSALYTNFGYKASPLRIEYRSCYATQEEWNDLVKSEINANRPVLYGGYTSQNSGHEFIIDGYDVNDFFHVNWGWDGTSNGFYSIVTLRPERSSSSFSESQSMVCGIEPDTLGSDKTPRQWRLYQYEAPSVKVDSIELGSSFTFTLGKWYNYSRTAHTWTYAVALYDLNGNQLKVLSSTGSSATVQYLSYYGPSKPVSVTAKLPEDLADGYYTLRAVYRQREKDANGKDIYKSYELPNMVGGQERNNVFIKVEGGIATLNIELPVGIHQLSADTSATVRTEYYDLGGRRIAEPQSGQIYIIRQFHANGSISMSKQLIR